MPPEMSPAISRLQTHEMERLSCLLSAQRLTIFPTTAAAEIALRRFRVHNLRNSKAPGMKQKWVALSWRRRVPDTQMEGGKLSFLPDALGMDHYTPYTCNPTVFAALARGLPVAPLSRDDRESVRFLQQVLIELGRMVPGAIRFASGLYGQFTATAVADDDARSRRVALLRRVDGTGGACSLLLRAVLQNHCAPLACHALACQTLGCHALPCESCQTLA